MMLYVQMVLYFYIVGWLSIHINPLYIHYMVWDSLYGLGIIVYP